MFINLTLCWGSYASLIKVYISSLVDMKILMAWFHCRFWKILKTLNKNWKNTLATNLTCSKMVVLDQIKSAKFITVWENLLLFIYLNDRLIIWLGLVSPLDVCCRLNLAVQVLKKDITRKNFQLKPQRRSKQQEKLWSVKCLKIV